jgi:hypothetical protein
MLNFMSAKMNHLHRLSLHNLKNRLHDSHILREKAGQETVIAAFWELYLAKPVWPLFCSKPSGRTSNCDLEEDVGFK